VRGIDLDVPEGTVFALLGPNGAGKTTTIKMLTTLLLPTAGTARVAGHDVARSPREVRRRVGYVFGGDRGLYERLSGRDNLRYFAELYGVDPAQQRRRIEEMLELVGMTDQAGNRVEHYSRGMRQRLHLARGLLHRPAVLFLDEPTVGLDPVAAREIRASVRDLAAAGTTILLTTHYLLEADELGDQLAVIDHGRIIATGTPDDLRKRTGERQVLELEAYGAADEQIDRLRALPGMLNVSVRPGELTQLISMQVAADAPPPWPGVLAVLDGVPTGRTGTREYTLEDAYVAVVTQPAPAP
jgi:ABC-2 type transport system ATP-binding protein